MQIDEYLKAQKMGEKEYDFCMSKGYHPYLSFLDDILSHYEIESRVKLGLVEIPIDQIVGTYNANRSTSFARNFMPILEPHTEFAAKWMALYDSMLEEGMREPVVAYEFLNKFYIQEGNKRVSVSKYNGSVAVDGIVTRIIPKKTDAKEIQMYYEFLSFYEKTGINYLTFTREGSFALLQRAVCVDLDTVWTEEERQDFRSAYICFKKEFLAKNGTKLGITPADAFLIYLNIYGYDNAKQSLSSDFRSAISKIWDEFVVYSHPESIAVSLNPIEDPGKSMLKKLISPKSHAAAWVYEKSADISAWTYSHELGREYVDDALGKQIQTEAFFDVSADSAEAVMEEIIADGYDIIFMTSPQYIAACAKVAINHPDVKILNCSLNMSYKHVRSYYLRMYEAKFLIGAIAGILTPNNRIGYLADYPVYGSTASINAFALGAAMVNPKAEVYLEWSTLRDHDPHTTFAEQNITLISSRDLNPPNRASREFGLYLSGDNPVSYAVPIWHWGKMYADILQSIIDGNWKDEQSSVGNHALNYWWGMSADAIDVIYSQKLPDGVKRLINLLQTSIRNGDFHPFSGQLTFQDGSTQDIDGTLAPDEIILMDRLVSNVHGFVPVIEDLREEFRPFMEAQGLFRPDKGTRL